MEGLIERRAAALVAESLEAFRVVVVHGPRQAGKSTLAQAAAARMGAPYITFDDEDQRQAAQADPRTFLDVIGTPAVFDEVQRAGDAFVLAIKAVVDRDPRPGRYLLTGSTNFLTIPTLSESLAGRVDIIPLLPLAEIERSGADGTFIDRAFAGVEALTAHDGATPSRDEYLKRCVQGGYPGLPGAGRSRQRWFSAYIDAVLAREVHDVADLRRADALAGMVRLLAASTAQELVVSKLAARLNLDRAAAATYEPWIETVFLAHRVPAWSRNLTAKVVRRPKIFAVDTGLAAAVLGKDVAALRRPTDPAAGPLVETLVANELTKQLPWADQPVRLHHMRETGGAEIDLVLEHGDGRVVGLEIKASSTPRREDARWLAQLRDRLRTHGDDFTCGIVLHTGEARLSLGDRLIALPVADLWT